MIIPIAFFFGAAVFYSVIAYTTGYFDRWVGIVLLAGFVVYMLTTVISMKKKPSSQIEEIENVSEHQIEEEQGEAVFSIKKFIVELVVIAVGGAFMIYKGGIICIIGIAVVAVFAVYALMNIFKFSRTNAMLRDIFFLVVGAGIIAGGANLLVDSGTEIATELGVPETVIALTFVALGTSLPELVTAITSLVKGHGALSLGNIIGANLFNLVLVSGVATVISPFPVPAKPQIAGMPASFIIDIPVMFCVMALMTVPALIRQKLSRTQGIILLCIYAAFCTVQFVV